MERTSFTTRGETVNRSELGNKLESLLRLQHAPIAISFMARPPSGVSRVKRPGPAGCSYWKMASDGETFYTTAEDHQNCTIGAYTHGVTLGPEKAKELQGTLSEMIRLDYLQEKEIPRVAHREEKFEIAAYGPLSATPFEAQIVLIRGTAKHLMMLAEAAARAGVGADSTMIRPTCAVIPQVLKSWQATLSMGCIGNRVYTELEDGEAYYAVAGAQIGQVVAELEKIVAANDALKEFHKPRCANV
ncbi:MAG: DUF169 domain-containing protein [Candidatus Acidiferrum sp.]